MRKLRDWELDEFLGCALFTCIALGVVVLLVIFYCKMANKGCWSPEAYELEEKTNTVKIKKIRNILSPRAEASHE